MPALVAMGTGETVAVASAPGKCFGEHAVVYAPAVAVALKQASPSDETRFLMERGWLTASSRTASSHLL